jgi:hypothetical protein
MRVHPQRILKGRSLFLKCAERSSAETGWLVRRDISAKERKEDWAMRPSACVALAAVCPLPTSLKIIIEKADRAYARRIRCSSVFGMCSLSRAVAHIVVPDDDGVIVVNERLLFALLPQ